LAGDPPRVVSTVGCLVLGKSYQGPVFLDRRSTSMRSALRSSAQGAVMLGDGHEAPLHIGIRCEACKLQVFDRSIPIFPRSGQREQFIPRA
jgi:hypothetical protein